MSTRYEKVCDGCMDAKETLLDGDGDVMLPESWSQITYYYNVNCTVTRDLCLSCAMKMHRFIHDLVPEPTDGPAL